MVKETLMGEKFKVYKNSPHCPICGNPMRYQYTHLASNRSSWKCRECDNTAITHGCPEDDEGDPSKRSLDYFAWLQLRERFSVPGVVDYGYKGFRERDFPIKDYKTKTSG
uniref:Putative transposase n=1 Tax=viral metagenome TaxID=1070528 RepID=A0A6M3L980_9ZZZZ